MDRRLQIGVRAGARSHDESARRVPPLTAPSASDWAGAVAALHEFFTGWFSGQIPDGPDGLALLEGSLADDFTIVSPRGDELDRAGTLEAIRRGRGSAAGGPWISIRDVRVLHDIPPFVLVRYVELQDWDDGRHTERLSTALLSADPAAAHGVRWHAVHETWVPGFGPSDQRP